MRFVLLDLSFYMYVLVIVVFPFVLFLLVIMLSVLLLYKDSDYPFGIFRLIFHCMFALNSLRELVILHYLIMVELFTVYTVSFHICCEIDKKRY